MLVWLLFGYSEYLTMAWPPPYRIRKSPRAKHVHLQFSFRRGLEVVIPQKQRTQVDVAMLLRTHRRWIEHRVREFNFEKQNDTQQFPPKKLELRAINESWQVEYFHAPKLPACTEVNSERRLEICAAQDAVSAILQRWLQQKGKQVLKQWIDNLSYDTGLHYRRLSIRGQKTRWGSCSQNKDISLNWKVLFLNENLVRHIILHELCHTKVLNHSSQFWALLRKFDADCDKHHEQCRSADALVPRWLD